MADGIDGQSNKASDEDAERVWNDPNCERTRGSDFIDWDALRQELHEVPYPANIGTINQIIGQLEGLAEMDREAALCPFGLIAVLFFFVKALVEAPEPRLAAAQTYHGILDGYASGMHPSLIDRADWLVRDSRLTALRRYLLRRIPPQAHPLLQGGSVSQGPMRIFVYDEKDVPGLPLLTQGATFCGKGQWGMEVHIHEWLLASELLTRDPEEADFFFVPGYSICMFEAGFLTMQQLDEVYTDVVRALPHYSRNGGVDHIFTFGSGMSVNLFRSWRREIPKSIFLTPETWLFNDFPEITEPCFDTWKDVAIPGYLHRHEILSLAGSARALRDREHLAVFLGRTDPSRGPHPSSGGSEPDVRGALRQLHLQGRIFVAQNLSLPEMHATMGNARFCFVPKGKSAWSLRFYEALFANCVPVVLSDHWELPYEEFLDVPKFVIKWPMANVGGELLDLLEQTPDSAIEDYMAWSRILRCWYVYPPLVHEVHLDPDTDDLLKVCPELGAANAYIGLLRSLERKRRASRTMDRFFGPATTRSS